MSDFIQQHVVNEDRLEEQACFLCLFSHMRPPAERDAPCIVKRLTGKLVWAREREVNGVRVPSLMLDLGLSLALISLDADYYRESVSDIYTRGKFEQDITVVVYHLHAPLKETIHHGKPLAHYVASPYTLVVLNPDTLLNITDLSQADYCHRKYLLNRLVASPPTSATIRGNVVHHSFTSLLKDADQSRSSAQEGQTSLEQMKTYAEQAINIHMVGMALANISSTELRQDVLPHLESLASWYEQNHATLWGTLSAVRAETLLLVPEIGLRGRLDLFWEQAGNQSLLELKTGGSTGDLPKSDHRRQVHGYQALLAVRQHAKMKKATAKLLYSGTPGQASNYALRLGLTELQRINAMRNALILSYHQGKPAAPPPPSRCSKCSMLDSCIRVSSLLDWQPPHTDFDDKDASQSSLNGLEASQALPVLASTPLKVVDNEEDRTFFARYYYMLHEEGKEGQRELANLWKQSVEERVAGGRAIQHVVAQHEPIVQDDGWVQTFLCENQSELREGDEVLVSDGDPIRGEVVTGTLLVVTTKSVTVWMRERIDHPTLIDSYGSDTVHMRTLQNLLRWLDANSRLRALVAGRAQPGFESVRKPTRGKLNDLQYAAVVRSMEMRDYLLIKGPPGTGKTSVIAEIVKNLVARGERVLLAAFTNQAVDNMLKRLEKEGFHDYLRLGHERSTDVLVQKRMLSGVLKHSLLEEQGEEASSLLRRLLQATSVVASTTATWSSSSYDPGLLSTEESRPFQFDVAIVDEASQLTTPSLLGALRFAKRFILVGDEQQLPPLVVSKKASELGLSESLFSFLSQRHSEACCSLRVQYRMNRWISQFPSKVFYNGMLVPHESVANYQLSGRGLSKEQRLLLASEPSSITQALRPDRPLVFLDVSGGSSVSAEVGGPMQEETRGAIAKANVAEALTIRDVIKSLLLRGIHTEDIGVIAPYRAQVATIRRTLLDDASALPIMVDTVDRFQGGEREVILLSFTTVSEPAKESLQREFLTNRNRLNVALTRAKSKLVLVGNVSALEHLPVLDRLIVYCRSMNTITAYTPVRKEIQTSLHTTG